MIIYPEDINLSLYTKYSAYSNSQKTSQLIDYPNLFMTEEDKSSKTYIKTTLDFFEGIAKHNYEHKFKTKKSNYDLLNGIINAKDLYYETKQEINQETSGLIELLNSAESLDKKYHEEIPDIVHYSIMTQPVNTIIGESTKRPDVSRPKAVDEDSKSEMSKFITSLMEEYITNKIRQRILAKIQAANKNTEVQNDPKAQEQLEQQLQEQVEKQTAEELQDRITNYSSVVEKWASVMIEACKIEFNIKEKSEIALRDLLAASEEFFIIKPDNTSTGFTFCELNPLSVWSFLPDNEKYTKNSYAAGYIREMSINEIIKEFNLPKEEVDILMEDLYGNLDSSGLHKSKSSPNAMIPSSHGDNRLSDSYISANEDNLRFPMSSEIYNKEVRFYDNNSKKSFNPVDIKKKTFTVTCAYFEAFRKVGKLVCLESVDTEENIDPNTGEQILHEVTKLVDETYNDGDHPNELSIEWTYDPQLYYGYKIGNYIYNIEEYDMLSYIPIIGVVANARNTEARGFVDMLKPFQSIYNLLINQLWAIAAKELGVTVTGSIRHIPNSEDGDNYDAIEDFKTTLREEGFLFTDDSVKNTKVPTSNTQPFRVIDLSRSQEMLSRINIAQAVKEEALALVGINRQRLGMVLSSDTVGGTNTATSQSYAQTEPIFTQHEYIMNQVYQAIIDAAIYTVVQNPSSSLTFINEEGDNEYFSISTDLLRTADIKLFFSSRGKDVQAFNALQQLAQPYLQNGGDIYDVSVLYTTNSIRVMQETYKKLKEHKFQMEQQQQQIQQQQMQQQQQLVEQQLEQQERHHQEDLQMKKYIADLEAQTQIKKEEIRTYFQDAGGDYNNNNTPDISEIATQQLNQQKFLSEQYNKQLDRETQKQTAQTKNQIEESKLELQRQKLELEREKIKSQERIAKENKNRFDK